jgi:ABC-type phosphate transport system substrate-binding protein
MKYRLILGCFLVTFTLVLTACGSSTAPSATSPAQSTPSGPQNVQVTITGTSMMSSLSNFASGMPYHFVVTNSGHVPYVFMMAPTE